MPNVLVTGGAGNIASALAKRLANNPDNRIVIVDNLLTGSLSKLPKGYGNAHFIKANVNDYHEISSIFLAHRFDYVFHFAAVVGVKRTLENPYLVLQDVKGIENVLVLSKNTGVKRVYYSSSSEVYGEPVELPQNEETTPLNSRLPYAIVKNLGEAYCRTFLPELGLPFTIFRWSTLAARMRCPPSTWQTKSFASPAQSPKSNFCHPLKEGDMTRRMPDLKKIMAIKEEFLPLESGIRNFQSHFANEDR